MTLTFAARIDGAEIACTIGSDEALAAPVFCFSLMSPARVVSGGVLVRSLAGYTEVALPDIPAGGAANVLLAPAQPEFCPANRAWLPLGGYLRVAGVALPLPELPGGVDLTARAPEPAPFEGLRLIPQPTEWHPAGGTVSVARLASTDPEFQRVAALAARLGLPDFLATDGVALTLTRDPALPSEGYRLTIGAEGIALAASGPAGIFAGGITLLNLRETYGGALPRGEIQDGPRFGWRGQHLDCARHFFRTDTIRRLLDLMALVKLNRFHWHFADDEAFRLDLAGCPDLAAKTAFRGEGMAVPGVFGGGIYAGGSYTREDAAALITHAADLHIQILPEVEVPAHAHAINAVVPGLTDPDDPQPEISIQGYPRNILNPAMPATWAFLEPMMAEVAALFPIGMLHLGCDELPLGAWEQSPAASALKSREGLAGRDDLQGWMMARLAGTLAKGGIRAAAWEEAAKGANGGIGHGALIFSWSGQGPGIAAARAGHDIVMCPAQHAYLDMAHTAALTDWGASWAGSLSLEETIAWQPMPAGMEDVADRIVGVQGCFWSEFTTTDAQMEPMIAPRILGLAHKAWSVTDSLTGQDLRSLAHHYAPLFDLIGWQRHPGA